jgi:hypothetical protein|tara:strand:- start:472 stop:912 length:441 start_codon:yes stop_codon:yes gene_type:complete
MLRYSDWPDRLSGFLKERHNTPFEWGKSDCCLFAADAVQAINGSDPAHFFRSKYSTMKEAIKFIKHFSGGGVEETVEKIFMEMGHKQVSLESSNSGDVVLMDVENVHPEAYGLTTGILFDKTMAIAQGTDGLVYVDNPDVKKVWAI